MTININVPVSWAELNPKQFLYACFLLSSGHYEPDQIKSLCLIRWGKLTEKQMEMLRPEQVAAFLPVMDWLLEIPQVPVCLPVLQKHEALYDAKVHGLPFEQWLNIENQYQGYLHRKDIAFLNTIAGVLYGADLHLSAAEAYSVFLWVASVKQYFAGRFTHFFVPLPVDASQQQDIHGQLVRSMNTQIRALTKGDITKEKEILAMDVYRALTELDAQAEEYNELKRMQEKHGK